MKYCCSINRSPVLIVVTVKEPAVTGFRMDAGTFMSIFNYLTMLSGSRICGEDIKKSGIFVHSAQEKRGIPRQGSDWI